MRNLIPLFLFVLFTSSLAAQVGDYTINSVSYKSAATAVNVSPDGQWILAGFEDGSVQVLDANTLEEIRTIKDAGTRAVFAIEMTPSMDLIMVASGTQIRLFTAEGEPVTTWNFHRTTIWNMDINPEGTYMISTEVNRTFLLINVFEGKLETQMRAHEDIVNAVEFSPDGQTMASGGADGEVLLWDFNSRAVISSYNGLVDRVYDVAFSPDGKLLAAGSQDGKVCIWNIADNTLVHLLKGHTEMVLEIEFSPDGKYLLSASGDQTIILWDVKNGDEVFSYIENDDSVPDIKFIPGKNEFVSVCLDGSIKIREINPEIFVIRYFPEAYEKEIASDDLFLPRHKGEKLSEYREREEKAMQRKQQIIQLYYRKYLESMEN